jgi:gluconate 2-dehydrogenase gamma chain
MARLRYHSAMNPALLPFEWLLAHARVLSRRRLIGWAATLPLVSACRSRKEPAAGTGDAGEAGARMAAGRVLGPREWKTIDAIVQRILPSDDGPGAREAGVIAFIDRQLASPPLSPLAPVVVELAKQIELHAQKAHGRAYTELSAADQDAMVAKLSRAELSLSLPERPLYDALHSLTLEGFLSDPNHGGNADQVGWKYVDFAEPTLREPGAPHRHSHLPVAH